MDGEREEELKNSEQLLLKEIREGVLDNWYAVEIKASLVGYEIDSSFIYKIIILHGTKSFYDILRNTLKDNDGLDKYFEDISLINKLMEIDGMDSYENPSQLWSPNVKVKVKPMLKSLDLRNPRYMLRYFLKYENPKYSLTYFTLFQDIIERTKIRAKKMKIFEDYVKRLEERYNETRTISLMCS